MDFGRALEHLREGGAVARHGWNSQDQFVYMVQQNSYPAQTGVAKQYFGEDAQVPYGPYLAIKSVQGTVYPWLASQSDLLTDDWFPVDLSKYEA